MTKCEEDNSCIGFHVQAAKLKLPPMCVTKHFSSLEERKIYTKGLEDKIRLSKMIVDEAEVLKYSKFKDERFEKIDFWHRQFENMTIENYGLRILVSMDCN